MVRQIVQIHPDAPPKPAWAQPCNGCGVCCLAEPCPLGGLVSRRWRGACARVYWDGDMRAYRCGLLRSTRRPGLGGWMLWPVQRLIQAWVRRWIAAGVGCDCSWDVEALGGGKDGS